MIFKRTAERTTLSPVSSTCLVVHSACSHPQGTNDTPAPSLQFTSVDGLGLTAFIRLNDPMEFAVVAFTVVQNRLDADADACPHRPPSSALVRIPA